MCFWASETELDRPSLCSSRRGPHRRERSGATTVIDVAIMVGVQRGGAVDLVAGSSVRELRSSIGLSSESPARRVRSHWVPTSWGAVNDSSPGLVAAGRLVRPVGEAGIRIAIQTDFMIERRDWGVGWLVANDVLSVHDCDWRWSAPIRSRLLRAGFESWSLPITSHWSPDSNLIRGHLGRI